MADLGRETMAIIGVILSGGNGNRFGGVRKMDLRLGGQTLLSRLAARLAPQCETVLLSVAANADVRPYGGTRGLHKVPDDPSGPPGPAGGLFSAARWCRENAPNALILTAAVDTPFFPRDFAARAAELLKKDTGCVTAAFGPDRYPTNTLWRRDALEAALDAMAPISGRGPALGALTGSIAQNVLDYRPTSAQNPFANINTLPDLLRLSRAL